MNAAVPAAIVPSRKKTAISLFAMESAGPARIRIMQPDITDIRARTMFTPRPASQRDSSPPPRLPISAAKNAAAVR